MEQGHQQWGKSALDGKSASLNGLIATLLERGCKDVTMLPEPRLRQFLDGPAVMTSPFLYLAVSNWTMQCLRHWQDLKDNGDDGDGGNVVRGGGGRDVSVNCNPRGEQQRSGTRHGDHPTLTQIIQKAALCLRDPSPFRVPGARPPARMMLPPRPPGSGETPIARTIAEEAGRRCSGPSGGGEDNACKDDNNNNN